jgi:hypothetical protein
MWNSSQLNTFDELSVALAGDYNFDGNVDAADYVVSRKMGINGPTGYETWLTTFGATSPGTGAGSGSASSSNTTVPEPASTLLLLMAAAIGTWRARRIASRVPSTRQLMR